MNVILNKKITRKVLNLIKNNLELTKLNDEQIEILEILIEETNQKIQLFELVKKTKKSIIIINRILYDLKELKILTME